MGYTTIFHIDDDDDDIEFFKAAVENISSAIICLSFNNSNKALQKMMSGESIPEVIFLDINMPIINGQEFLYILKATASLQNIPVIVLSTSSDPDKIQQLKLEGASDFLTKPSNIKELVNLLRPYLI